MFGLVRKRGLCTQTHNLKLDLGSRVSGGQGR